MSEDAGQFQERVPSRIPFWELGPVTELLSHEAFYRLRQFSVPFFPFHSSIRHLQDPRAPRVLLGGTGVVAGRSGGKVPVIGLDPEPDRRDPALRGGPDREAGVIEDAQHLTVFGEGLGDEPGDAACPGGFREVLEQKGPDPVVLVLVGDDEGHLRLVRSGLPFVASDRDQTVPVQRDQCEPLEVVDMGESRDLRIRERRMSGEETAIDRTG